MNYKYSKHGNQLFHTLYLQYINTAIYMPYIFLLFLSLPPPSPVFIETFSWVKVLEFNMKLKYPVNDEHTQTCKLIKM